MAACPRPERYRARSRSRSPHRRRFASAGRRFRSTGTPTSSASIAISAGTPEPSPIGLRNWTNSAPPCRTARSASANTARAQASSSMRNTPPPSPQPKATGTPRNGNPSSMKPPGARSRSAHGSGATYVWSMFDFASDARDEGDTPGRNDKGLVTADREIKKDAFYFYKANWTEDPFVHICEKRFDPRPAGPAELKVYSNCDSVELFLNGKSLGNRSSSDHVFVWNQVLLRQGKCELSAVGEKNAQRFVDDCSWTVSSNAAPRPFGQGVTTSPAAGHALNRIKIQIQGQDRRSDSRNGRSAEHLSG